MRRAAALAALLVLAGCARAPASSTEQNGTAAQAPGLPPAAVEAATSAEPAPAESLPVRGEGPPLPADGAVLTRIAVGSCSEETKDLPIFAAVAAAKPDLFLYVGDNVYGDVRANEPGADDPALPKLKQAYADLALNAQFAAFNMSTPILATWNDHDFGRNDAGAEFPFKERAERMFESFWTTASLGNDHPGVYGARTFGPAGQRVQVIMLDTRFFRSGLKKGEPDANGRRPYVPQTEPGATLLGDAQWRWLEAELKRPADIRLLVSSIQVLSDNHPFEAWWTMPAEQKRLYDIVRASRAKGVVLVSGDRHVGALYRKVGLAPYPLHELTASSLNRDFVKSDAEMGSAQLGKVYTPANFGLIEIDWKARSLALSVRGLDGAAVRRLAIPFRDLGLG